MFEHAKWIWCKDAPELNAYAVFECDFEAPAGAVRLDISADQQYAVYLNGGLAFAGQYPDYPEYKVYDSEDVTAFLRPGRNTLRVEAYCIGRDNSVYRRGSAGVIFEISALPAGADASACAEAVCLAASGEQTRAAVHPGFVSGGGVDQMTNQQGYTFDMDLTAGAPEWQPAVCVPGANAFHPRPVKRLVTEDRRPARLISQGIYTDAAGQTNGERMQRAALAYREKKSLTDGTDFTFPNGGVRFVRGEGEGVYLAFDLGAEDVGWPEIEIELDEPCTVLLGWGEHLDDLRPRTYVGKRNYAVSCKFPAGRTSALNPLKRLGLRYLMLFVPAKAFTLYYAGIRPTNYPFDLSPEFSVSDALHRRIAEISRRTLIGCAHEHYEDCPMREQALYAMDSRNQMLCGYYAFGEYDMPRESLRLLALSLREDDLLELCAPARVTITIPSFTAAFLAELAEYHLFSGDTEFFLEMLPVARRIADGFLARMGADGLIPVYEGKQFWNFYEWQPGLQGELSGEMPEGGTRVDAPMNCFAILGLNALARAMEDAGEDASAYRNAVRTLKKAVRGRFWDEEKQAFATYALGENRWHYAELTQALAVCADVAEGDVLDAALERLTDETLTPVTLSYSIFQFDALMKRPQKYARWVFERVARDWGKMLYAGATTFWETILGGDDFEDAGSLCHGWSAVPLYLYYRYALGAYPTRPGFAEYEVKPVPCGLYELSGTVRTADGRTIRL